MKSIYRAARFVHLLAMLACIPIGCVPANTAEVSRYRDVLDGGIDEPTLPPPGAPLTLSRAMMLANAYNESLNLEGENYLRALIERRRALLTFLPTLSLVPSYFLRDEVNSGGQELDDLGQPLGGGPATEGKDLSIEARLSTSPVSDTALALAAGTTVEGRKALLLDLQDRFLLDVARAYYETIRSEKLVEVLRSSIELQEARLSDVRARNEVGTASVLDVSLTQSLGAQRRTDLIQAEVTARNSRSLLEFLTTWPGSRTAHLEDSLIRPASALDAGELLSEALATRQDLRLASSNVETAEYRVKSAYGEYFPSLSLNLSYFLSRESEPTDRKWNSLIELSLPLFSAGLIEANVRSAVSDLRRAKLSYSQALRRIKREVQVAHESWSGAERRFLQVEVQLQSAVNAYDAAQVMYQAGLATNLERLTSENDLISARLQLTNADLERNLAYLDLRRMTGSLHKVVGLDREKHLDSGRGESNA